MTLDEIRASDKDVLTVAEAASVLHVSAQLLRIQARQRPQTLPFPVVIYGANGRNIRIPRLAFIAAMEGIA